MLPVAAARARPFCRFAAMSTPVSPTTALRVAPGPAGSVDDDASLTVDQVSEDPPEVRSVLAVACRDALLQSAPCRLYTQEKAGIRPVIRLPRPRPASAPKPSLAMVASQIKRPVAKSTMSGRGGLAKGEQVSLDGSSNSLSEELALSCRERGPRLAITSRYPEVIEEEFDEIPAPVDEIDTSPLSQAPAVEPAPLKNTTVAPSIAISQRSAALRVKLSALRKTTNSPAPPATESPPPPAPEGPKTIGLISDFDEPLPLDPRQAYGIPIRPPQTSTRTKRRLHPKAVALFGGLFGLAVVTTLITFAVRFGGPAPTKPAPSAKPTVSSTTVAQAPSASTSGNTQGEPSSPPEPGPWRVAALSGEEGVKIVSGKMGTRSLMDALEAEKIPKAQIFRILNAFDDPKIFDKSRKLHQYTVAIDRDSKRVRGFEYAASATEVWQAREIDEKLKGVKLDLHVEQRRVTKGVVVSDSLKTALVEAGLDASMMNVLDDVLGERISIERLGKGTRLRIVAQEQLVSGRFSKYLVVDSVEYQLPRADKPVRLYNFRSGKSAGIFDTNGKAPFRTSWGAPVKVVRITSKFNPKRLHPVLHTVMPHNGTDFGAPAGTPVYAVAAGTVTQVGPQGPSGNLVLVTHSNGIETGYAHLSRFAQGLKKGDKVESQQLVGYVGSTGRSTGPHLHFSMKKNGAFIDALTVLKLNQERVIPPSDRDAFGVFRAEMDPLLDAIPLADAPPGDNTPGTEDGETGDTNNHEEEGATSAAPSPSAAPSASANEFPPVPPVTDETSPESAIWRPD